MTIVSNEMPVTLPTWERGRPGAVDKFNKVGELSFRSHPASGGRRNLSFEVHPLHWA